VGELTSEPRMPLLHGELESRIRLRECSRAVPDEPRRLRPRCGNESEALKLTARLRHFECPIERCPNVGVTAPCSDLSEHCQSDERRQAGCPGSGEDAVRGICRSRPVASVEMATSTFGAEALSKVSEFSLPAILEPGIQVPIDERVLSPMHGDPHDV